MADIVPGVPYIIRWSPNHGDARSKTIGAVMHSTHGPSARRSGESLEAWYEREYQANITYMLKTKEQGNTNQVSPTFLVGTKQVCRLIPDPLDPWCQRYPDNDTHLAIEIAKPASAASQRLPFLDFQYDACADILARWALVYDFPLIRVTEEWREGIIAHRDTTSGEQSKKWDPDGSFDWAKLLAKADAVYDQITYDPFKGIHADIVAYYKAHPEIGLPRHGSGLYYVDGADDIVSKSTKGAIVVRRNYDPNEDGIHQVKHLVW